MDIENRIKLVMSKILEVSIKEIDRNAEPHKFDNWDSLNHLNLIIALEEEFDINFSDDELSELLNFKLILSIIENKISK